jgi:hypothetical protein
MSRTKLKPQRCAECGCLSYELSPARLCMACHAHIETTRRDRGYLREQDSGNPFGCFTSRLSEPQPAMEPQHDPM